MSCCACVDASGADFCQPMAIALQSCCVLTVLLQGFSRATVGLYASVIFACALWRRRAPAAYARWREAAAASMRVLFFLPFMIWPNTTRVSPCWLLVPRVWVEGCWLLLPSCWPVLAAV